MHAQHFKGVYGVEKVGKVDDLLKVEDVEKVKEVEKVEGMFFQDQSNIFASLTVLKPCMLSIVNFLTKPVPFCIF